MPKFIDFCNPKKSFSVKLLIYSVFLLSLVIFSVSYYSFAQIHKIFTNALEKKGVTVTKNLAFSSELGVLSDNKDFLEKPARAILEIEDVTYVGIFNLEGSAIFLDGTQLPADPTLDKEVILQAEKKGSYTKFSENSCDFVVPVYSKPLMTDFSDYDSQDTQKQVVGFARVVFSLNSLEAEKGKIITNFSLIFLVIFVFAFALSIWFSRIVTKPLDLLSKGASKIQRGELDHTIQVNSCDEIGELAKQFNLMTKSLRETINQKDSFANELKELNANLEHKVRDRTKEIQEANEKLNKAVRSIAEKNLNLLATQEELEAKNTEIKQVLDNLQNAQIQLIQVEKMSALGKLVAGIAHEINTPMGAINSNADISSKCIDKIENLLIDPQNCSDPSFHKKFAKFVEILKSSNTVTQTACERIVRLVRSLRNFARLDESELKKVNLTEGLESTLTLVHHELKNRIKIIRNFGEIPEIECHPNQINQVFMNILVNASQSMGKEGTIEIKTFVENNFVNIEISDTGKGISPENLTKIFDPGFTTKGVGVGTGLGLSIVHKIIEDHKGKISVKSEPGKGTTFSIKLPVTNEKKIL
ncbi:HAMP domain-containing protein [bacterium]|nr:HAMP domain-containing protein [bacterium]